MTQPTRFTKPLVAGEDGLPLYSDGYDLCKFVDKYVKLNGRALVLDQWQRHLLIRILEVYPPDHEKAGELRYRQVVVSIPRQAGKSVLAAILGLYGLLQHSHSPKVLGLARGVEQANIVYKMAAAAISGSAALSARLKATGTRGITHRLNGGSYKVLPANPDAVQGYPSTLAICDELHVMQPDIWDAIVTSQRAQTNSVVVGITTAGDINSTLLKRLYAQGADAIAEPGRFGFFCWEAPEGMGLTEEALKIAHPAVACGRLDAQSIINDEKHSPESNWRRFALNQFWEGQAEPWVPTEHWHACKGTGITEKSGLVYSFDSTPGMGHASISVSRRNGEVLETTKIASIVQPDLEQLVRIAKRLKAENGKGVFAMDTYVLGDLANRLERLGYEVFRIGANENRKAAGLCYSLISKHQVNHNNDEVIAVQMKNAKIKTTGEAFRIVRGTGDIDAVMSMVYGVYVAAVHERKVPMLAAF